MELVVLDNTGKDTGRKITLAEDIFNVEPNDHAIYLDIKSYLANQRQGTHKSKERAEVAFSTKKIKKQKGTGGARAGSVKSPLFRKGGRAFGPRPRDYHFKLNKKLKVVARKSALSYKATEANISVISDFTFQSPKTKDYITFLNSLSLQDKKTLLIISQVDDNVILSSRNLSRAKVITADQITTYDVLNADKLLIAEGSLEKISNILNK
ncbi:MAG TPA: 50S ribosomal protein L4 [Cytophagales bacterium]|nr:50S ribosomal protein L4 [Cytophagales bacterium]